MSQCYDARSPAIAPGLFHREHDVKCPYCGCRARKVTGKEIYPHRKKLWKRKYLACVPCDAYVGCHKTEGHKFKAFGPLANGPLRKLRQAAHRAFDPIWESEGNQITRSEAYLWLAAQMGLTREETHIGMFDEEQCRRAIALCRLPPKGKQQ